MPTAHAKKWSQPHSPALPGCFDTLLHCKSWHNNRIVRHPIYQKRQSPPSWHTGMSKRARATGGSIFLCHKYGKMIFDHCNFREGKETHNTVYKFHKKIIKIRMAHEAECLASAYYSQFRRDHAPTANSQDVVTPHDREYSRRKQSVQCA